VEEAEGLSKLDRFFRFDEMNFWLSRSRDLINNLETYGCPTFWESIGLPRSGKSTALKALYLVCRRGMITSDISSAAFYRACDRLTPTICIDEAATAGQKKTLFLFHLLRSGTTRQAIAFREGQSYRAFGAKIVTWTEMPNDDALNSRCTSFPCKRPRARTS
jgi:hypothetical protein